MKRKICSLLSVLMLASAITFSVPPVQVSAADFTATVNFSTTSPTAIDIGITGFHEATSTAQHNLNETSLINEMNNYDRVGYVRMQGTTINVMNWKTGALDPEMIAQVEANDKKYRMWEEGYMLTEARGFERWDDIRDFAQKTGVKLVITCNVFEMTMREIGEMAKYCYDNHLPVLHFELGNEVDFFTAESEDGLWPEKFKTGTDYLDRMRAYDTHIKRFYPGAKVIAVMSNIDKYNFNSDFLNYANPYWDGIAFHRFLGDGATFDEGMANANQELYDWNNVINGYLDDLSNKNTKFHLGEISTGLGGILSLSQYNGIVVAESMLRLSGHPNIESFQSWRLTGGIGTQKADYSDKLIDAYQRGETVDTEALNIQYFDEAPGEAARVVDGAINNSSAVYSTTTTGGTTVARGTSGATMPALYSKAYRGANGKDYVVITNKSAYSHDVTIKKDNINVNTEMSKTYVTADKAAENSATNIRVYTQTETVAAGSPVNIAPYSVTRVEWTRSATPEKPPVPWLSHADPYSGRVDLKWLRSVNAAGYKIKYGTSPTTMTNIIDAGNVTSYSVTGLTNGATYYFGVAAYNAGGTSAYSSDVLQNGVVYNDVSVALTTPAAPVYNVAHHEKAKRIVTGWKSVPGAAGYKLYYGTSPGVYTNVIDVGNRTGYIVKGLLNETNYYFKASAYNSFGESALSSEELSASPSGARPLAPRDLEITGETDTSIDLKWTPTLKDKQYDYFEGGTGQWTVGTGVWGIVDHFNTGRETKVYQSPSTDVAVSAFTGGATGDQEGSARVEVNGTFTSGQVGVAANYTNINNYYRFIYDAGGDIFRIVEVSGGTTTVRASILRTDAGIKNVNDMTMRIIVNNGKVTGMIGSNEILSWTDTTPLAAGYFGLYSHRRSAVFDMVQLKKDVALRFNVYRSTNSTLEEDFVLVGSDVTGTNWSQSGLNAANKYYYRVTAENNYGESYGHSNTQLKD